MLFNSLMMISIRKNVYNLITRIYKYKKKSLRKYAGPLNVKNN